MRVRVYVPALNRCFQAELYATFSHGVFERCLILRDGKLQCFPRFFQETPDGPYRTQTSFIDAAFPGEWCSLPDADPAFSGYPWVLEDRETVRRLLAGEAVPLAETQFADKTVSSLLPGWNYVATQENADALMEHACGFHDSVLAELQYASGSRLHADGSLTVGDTDRRVTMLFHSQLCPPLELVFEGVTGLNLRPGGNSVCSALLEATLRVRDAAVFFCGGSCGPGEEADYPGTKIFAYSLRWRFLPPIHSSSTSK